MDFDITHTKYMGIDGLIEVEHDKVYLFRVEDNDYYLSTIHNNGDSDIKTSEEDIPNEVIDLVEDKVREDF
jgi:hypothetical protein